MRLFEIAPDYTKSQLGVLKTILYHIQSKLPGGTEVPFTRVIDLMNNAGYPFSYEEFKDLYDKDPSISKVVTDHSEQTITVGKGSSKETGDIDVDARVDSMAKSAMKAGM